MKNKPSYGLKKITVENFRGIKKTEVTDIPEDTAWIFLTGNNGYGKTSFLQSIFIGLLGKRSESLLFDSEDFTISVEIESSRGLYRNEVSKIAETSFGNYVFDKTCAYGSARLSIQNDSSKGESEKRSAVSYSLFNSDGVLLSIENELRSWYFRSSADTVSDELRKHFKKRYESVRSTLIGLMPGVSSIEVNAEKDTVEYFEKGADGKLLDKPVPFEHLASGYRSVIAMVGDLILRLFKTQPQIDDPKELEGIVLIDELDVHLHPIWQKKIPQLLSAAFPKIQFIASTHSPIPFLGAPENSVFLKVNRAVEVGITVEKLEIDVSDWTPNLILSSPIFGFSEIIPVTHNEDRPIRTEDKFSDYMLNNSLTERLKNYSGSEREKELLRILSE